MTRTLAIAKDGEGGQDARMRLSILIQQRYGNKDNDPPLTLRQKLDICEGLALEVYGVRAKFDKASEIDPDIAASLADYLEQGGAA